MSICKQCGIVVETKHRMQNQHRLSRWHIMAPVARELRREGLSFSEIARRLEMTRAYVGQRFNYWGRKK